jgi:transcriptional regulator with XRE-family HTH domain
MWQTSGMSDELEQALSAVGPRLRALRRQRDITLTDLSAQTGVSLSTLSRLESGDRKPTLELLLPLARAYGVTLDELVDAPPTGDPRVHMRPFKQSGMTAIPLTQRAGGIQAYKMIIPVGGRRGHDEEDLKTHEGYEWVYVLDGRLRLRLGDHDLTLGPGEAAEFDTRVPHWFGTVSKQESVEILSLFGREGQRAHLRARPAKPGSTSTD